MQTRVIQVDGKQDFSRKLAPAVRAMRAGRIVGFPTETVYGIGVVATDAGAVQRLRALKQRPTGAFTVHLAAPEEARRYVRDIPIRAATLMRKAWPGPLTILLRAGGQFADRRLGGKALFQRVCEGDVVGLRCVDDVAARLLLERVGKPVVATSANLAGQRAPASAEEVLAQLGGQIDVLVDSGPARYGRASTIVAFEGQNYRLLREGVYDARMIERLSSRTILFVCTGNTCRSPMAAAMAAELLAERMGCAVAELPAFGQRILSAGTTAAENAPATVEAVLAAKQWGADVGKHRARGLSNELILAADLIFCMARAHVEEVIERVPAAARKTFLLDGGGNIPDPIGRGVEAYVDAAGRIGRGLRKRMKENLL